jgi:Domain of unknown function (DUF1707)
LLRDSGLAHNSSVADDVEEARPVPGEPFAPATGTPTAVPDIEVITDEERNRYGSLLDRAAERGLLEPSEYEVRLRELAQATSTEEMMQIVTELPVFNPSTPSPAPKKARSARHGEVRGVAQPGSRRQMTLWALMGLLVVVAVASLVFLAVSAERLTHRPGHGSGAGPVVTRDVSGLRL